MIVILRKSLIKLPEKARQTFKLMHLVKLNTVKKCNEAQFKYLSKFSKYFLILSQQELEKLPVTKKGVYIPSRR